MKDDEWTNIILGKTKPSDIVNKQEVVQTLHDVIAALRFLLAKEKNITVGKDLHLQIQTLVKTKRNVLRLS